METTAKSEKQGKGEDNTLRDLIVNFRKPRIGEVASSIQFTGSEDQSTFTQKVRAILSDYLDAHPGATKNQILEEVVSRMVRKGQLEHYDLMEQLEVIADEVREPVANTAFQNQSANRLGKQELGRWYLKDSEDRLDAAETEKEDQASSLLAEHIVKLLQRHPHEEGLGYGALLEQYIFIVKDKPRRQLADWLPDYFIKTLSGTWRLPSEDERKQLAALRQAGTLRRIKRFANALIEGTPVRDKDRPGSDVDALDWLRQCRRAGLYEQGKAIYEKGGLNSANLTDEQQIEAEDDYRICARRDSTEEAKPKHTSRKKQGDDE